MASGILHDVIAQHVLKQLHKERFASIKKFLSEFDKVFQKEGFLDLKAEIQAKNNKIYILIGSLPIISLTFSI